MHFPGQLDGYTSYFGNRGYIEPPFETYRRKGFEYADELEQDTHLRGQLEFRFRSAVNPGWQIDPASLSKQDQEIADFVKWNFEELEDTFITGLQKVWQAVPRGFSLTEPIFEKTGDDSPYPNSFRLQRLRQIPQKYVRFDYDVYGNIKPDGVVLYPNPSKRHLDEKLKQGQRFKIADFIHCTYGATDNPYGDGVTLRSAFPVFVKREGWKMWAYYGESFGGPAIAIELPASSSTGTDTNSDEAKARNILSDFRSFGGLVMPKGFKLQLLEALRSGDPTYSGLLQFCDNAISKIVVGSTLATEAGAKNSGASYALGAQHGQVSQTVAYTDALWLEYVVNTKIIRKLVRMNYGVDRFPKFRLLEDNWKDMLAFSQALPQLLAAGFKIPLEWSHNRIGIPLPAADDKVLIPVASQQQPSAPSPKPDNNLRAAASAQSAQRHAAPVEFASESDDPLTRFPDPVAAQLEIDKLATAAVFVYLRDTIDSYVSFAGTFSTAPNPNTPAPAANPGPVKRAFMAAGLLSYLLGKRTTAEGFNGRIPLIDHGPLNLPVAFRPKNDPEKAFRLAMAVEKLKSVPLTQPELDALSAAYEAQFHEIAGLVKSDMEVIWQKQLSAFQEGWDLRSFEKSLKEAVIRYAGPVYGSASNIGRPIFKHHLELIYRNGMNKTYSEGQDALAEDPEVDPFFWGWQYSALLDDRVRPDHMDLEGITLPTDHEFWLHRTPPWDHNCRCTRIPVLTFDIEDGLQTETPVTSLPEYKTPPASGFIR